MLAVFIGAEFGTRMDNPAIYKSGEYGIQIKFILASSTDSLADLPELEFVIDLLKEKIPAIVPLNLIFWYLNGLIQWDENQSRSFLLLFCQLSGIRFCPLIRILISGLDSNLIQISQLLYHTIGMFPVVIGG